MLIQKAFSITVLLIVPVWITVCQGIRDSVFEIERIDTVACPEAFAGALAASIAAGDHSKNAARFAAAAGALACSRFGSPETLPSKEEIIELLQEQPD